MAHIVCLVQPTATGVSLTWSEGPAAFSPYDLSAKGLTENEDEGARTRFLTHDEFQRLRHWAGKSTWPRLEALVVLAVTTALRAGALQAMTTNGCSNMTDVHLVEGAGHWVQQEQAAEISALLLDFLRKTRESANL